MINIAIDGPSGVGKSTIAKALAAKLGYIYIDTGAMFRGIGVYAIDNGLDIENESDISKAAATIDERIEYINGEQHVFVNGKDVTERLRTEDVSKAASVVSRYQQVRDKVLELERKLAKTENAIMDGRDIGTVVLPDAAVKLFIIARPEVQAERRYRQLEKSGKLGDATYESILKDIKERDYRDSHREIAPLKKADDAVEIDTSDMEKEEVLEYVLKLIEPKI